MQVKWLVKAVEQREGILQHIAKDSVGAALRIDGRIGDEAGALSRFPFLGRRSRRSNYRLLVVRSTDYLIAYRVTGGIVTVCAVFHGRREISQRF